MSDLLKRIVKQKEAEVRKLEADRDFRDSVSALLRDPTLRPSRPSFQDALRRASGGPIRVIAESKKASPSLGLIRKDYDAAENARLYKELGASALSVLTDQTFFSGSLSDLRRTLDAGLPVLRKDFVISELQVYEAALAGASAVLLIVRILNKDQLHFLYKEARRVGLDVLVETHSESEIEAALELSAKIIGINHRNLDTLEMDLSLTPRMAPAIRRENPKAIVIAESGVESPEGLRQVDAHADAVLIGSALMQSPDIRSAWQGIFG